MAQVDGMESAQNQTVHIDQVGGHFLPTECTFLVQLGWQERQLRASAGAMPLPVRGQGVSTQP